MGRITSHLVKRCSNVVAVDISANMIRELKGSAAHLVVADIANLPFKEATFDLVISVATLECLTDDSLLQKTVKDLNKLLKRCGRIIILESITHEGEKYSDFVKPRTIDYWINLFYKEGLTLTSCRGADPHVISDLIRKFKQRIKHKKSSERLYIRVNGRLLSKLYTIYLLT